MYMFVDPKKIKSYFSDRLTFSNIRGRNSLQIYRLTRPLLSPEMLSSLSKLRIFLFNVHHALFVRRMTVAQFLGKYRHLVNRPWNLPLSTIPSPLADQTTRRIIEELVKNVNVRSSA